MDSVEKDLIDYINSPTGQFNLLYEDAGKKFTVEAFEAAVPFIEKGYPMGQYLMDGYNPSQIRQIGKAYEYDLDVNQISDKNLSADEMKKIRNDMMRKSGVPLVKLLGAAKF